MNTVTVFLPFFTFVAFVCWQVPRSARSQCATASIETWFCGASTWRFPADPSWSFVVERAVGRAPSSVSCHVLLNSFWMFLVVAWERFAQNKSIWGSWARRTLLDLKHMWLLYLCLRLQVVGLRGESVVLSLLFFFFWNLKAILIRKAFCRGHHFWCWSIFADNENHWSL